MSQDDLASALDVSRQSVSKWENNNAVPELEKLIRMSQLFGVTLDDLVNNTPPHPEPPSEPQTAPGVTTGDLLSIVLLLAAIIAQLVILLTAHIHLFYLILGLYVIPLLVSFVAAFCSPKNRLLFHVYTGYIIVSGILAAISLSIFAPVVIIIFYAPLAFWHHRLEN